MTDADDQDAVGAVVSATVTATVAGEPDEIAVWAFPAVSATEKLAARVNVEFRAPPPAVAVEVAVMVQTVDDVWTIDVMAEMFVKVKSVPLLDESVAQLMGSLPVSVNVIVAEFDVAEDAASVNVGGVLSTATGTQRTMTTPSPPDVIALLPPSSARPPPPAPVFTRPTTAAVPVDPLPPPAPPVELLPPAPPVPNAPLPPVRPAPPPPPAP